MVYCVWRVETTERVIASSYDPNDNKGPMVRGLRRFVGETVSKLVVTAPAGDLMLQFTNDKNLRVFCDHTIAAGRGTNWCFFDRMAGFAIAVDSGGRIHTEKCYADPRLRGPK